jgi:alkylation response protein AidB-like acyl-CoA dehydrogenase
VLRQRLAAAYADCEIMRLSGLRALGPLLRGEEPGPAASVSKLFWSEYHQRVTELAVDILGPDALVPSGRAPSNMVRTDDPGAPDDSASWTGTFLNARAGTIYAGTSQVQRNILGEQVLGLPREPRPPE